MLRIKTPPLIKTHFLIKTPPLILAFFAVIALSANNSANNLQASIVICGDVDFEQLFLDAFDPGTAGTTGGIGINSDGSLTSQASSTPSTASVNVDVDGDGTDDITVNMGWSLYQNGDSRIGFREQSGGITMFSDSNTGTDFDYGFLQLDWNITGIASNISVTSVGAMTTGSLNGETELYEFGIIDTGGSITAADISSYNADDYTGGDGTFSGGLNSLGDAAEVLLPEHIGTLAGVTYDAEATITGDLGNNPNTTGDATDNISAGGANLTLWYGGFDVGTDTNVGSPTGSFNWDTEVKLLQTPEPTSTLLFGIALGGLGLFRRRRSA